MGGGRRRRNALAVGTVLAGILLAGGPCAFALNPALDVSQYAHTAWRIREGFSKGTIFALAQTPDGYLWLATEFGLLRFDGVRNVPWQPPPDQHLPSNKIWSLVAARDGTLWIGTSKGLASWKGGKLTQYAELAGMEIFGLLEDHEGALWAGGWELPTGRLCTIQRGSVRCYGEDGLLGRGVAGSYEDRKGNLWMGVAAGLWRWKPGPPEFYPLAFESNGIQGMAEGDDGALLIGTRSGIKRLVDGKIEAHPLPGPVPEFQAHRLLRDRDGGLWIGTSDKGVVHVHEGRTDVFARPEGLSGDDVSAFLEDREGNIWVSTRDGLDRFRDVAVPTFSVGQGLSNARVTSVLSARDGSVWLGTYDGLNRWNHGHVTIYRDRGDRPPVPAALRGAVRELTRSGLPDQRLGSLFQDDGGRIWMSTLRGAGYLENDRYVSVSGVPAGQMYSITGDAAGNVWIANQEHGLFHLLGGSVVEQIPWTRLGHKDASMALIADPSPGGLWIGFMQGGAVHYKDGEVRASYTAADGLGEGRVNDFRFDREGTLWAATEGGLSRFKNGRIATLAGKNGLPCDAVHWAIEDDADSYWLYTACGLVRIARTELRAWASAVDKNEPRRTIQTTVFGSSAGVRIRANVGGHSPHVAKSPDGKLWFLPLDGVSVVDPRHLPFNSLPPPVHIEQVLADRKTYDLASAGRGGLRLPALIRDVEIDYTALSLVAPEEVHFRYKLQGWDRDWQDAGNRRQAYYGNLPPRPYRFQVRASNNSGVWNEAGASLDFSIDPVYYQTNLFRFSVAAVLLVLLGALYQLRLRQLARQFNIRLEERVSERTRIARDLHDTLLQSFQGVLLQFHAVGYLLEDRPEARERLESVVEQARQAVTEGRDAVQGLRSSTVVTNDLARAISTFGEELAAGQTGQNRSEFHVHVEGTTKDLAPIVRDEVYRIAGEALRNAFQHAHAGRIEVEIRYARRQLRLRIRDNGRGIAPEILGEGGRAGHYGLAGMRERARLVGGKLAISSRIDSGTEAELTIPASVAYLRSPIARRSMFSGSGT